MLMVALTGAIVAIVLLVWGIYATQRFPGSTHGNAGQVTGRRPPPLHVH